MKLHTLWVCVCFLFCFVLNFLNRKNTLKITQFSLPVCDVILKMSAEKIHLLMTLYLNKRLIHLSLIAVYWFPYKKPKGSRKLHLHCQVVRYLFHSHTEIDLNSVNQSK